MGSKLLIAGLVCLIVLWMGCVEQPEVTTTTTITSPTSTTILTTTPTTTSTTTTTTTTSTITTTTIPIETLILPCEKEKTDDEWDDCLYDIAKESGNPEACKGIKYRPRRLMCIAVISEDISLCNKTKRIEACIWGIARRTGNSSLCEKIEESSVKYKCLADVKKDPSECKKIEDEGDKDWCYFDLATITTHDISLCKFINLEGARKTCYIRTVKATKNASLCEKVPYEIKGSCYFDLAEELKDASLCEKVSSNPRSCYFNLAKITGDESLCLNISERGDDIYWREICIAVVRKSTYTCTRLLNDVETEGWGEFCFREVQAAADDAT